MNICFMCDLHLPFDEEAVHYQALDWAVEEIKRRKPDCVACAGDITCDGNKAVYEKFLKKMKRLDVSFLYIPGNSDLRNIESREHLTQLASPCRNKIEEQIVYAVNDCDGIVSEDTLKLLETAEENSIVFMHHPVEGLAQEQKEKMVHWRNAHPNVVLFYGHKHVSEQKGNDISLQALDPDKAIGECPCITFYDTETKEISKVHFDCPMPADFYQCLGISCYKVLEHLQYAIERNLKCVELRSNCANVDIEVLAELVANWRKSGGETLSIHLPNDIGYEDGKVVPSPDLESVLAVAERLGADRLNQHAPSVPMGIVKAHPEALEEIASFLAEKLNDLSRTIVIGVENMHMKPGEPADDSRLFGYLPEECLYFMQLLAEKCRHKVGINLDIGHARNNAPYSQKYQVGTWYSQVGKHIVSYHMHQVLEEKGAFENHMAITEPYGRLISYASFFKCWEDGQLNKAPVILEMRQENGYEITLDMFQSLSS